MPLSAVSPPPSSPFSRCSLQDVLEGLAAQGRRFPYEAAGFLVDELAKRWARGHDLGVVDARLGRVDARQLRFTSRGDLLLLLDPSRNEYTFEEPVPTAEWLLRAIFLRLVSGAVEPAFPFGNIWDPSPGRGPSLPEARTARHDFSEADWLRFVEPFLVPVEHSVPSARPELRAAEDSAARLVYADWLEEQGQVARAEWLRLELTLRDTKGAARTTALKRLRALGPEVGRDFMADFARVPLEGCPVAFGLVCPLQWSDLERTADPLLRFCGTCGEHVNWCDTVKDAQRVAADGGCVALNPVRRRSPSDVVVDRWSPRATTGIPAHGPGQDRFF